MILVTRTITSFIVSMLNYPLKNYFCKIRKCWLGISFIIYNIPAYLISKSDSFHRYSLVNMFSGTSFVMTVYFIYHSAYYNDIVVGAVCCRVDKSDNSRRLYIMTLGCLAPYRRLGIGKTILCFLQISVAFLEQRLEIFIV